MEKNESGFSGAKPCYAPYTTFVNTLRKFKDTSVPTQIDSSVLSNQSGSMASAVKKTFEFLGATESNGATTETLERLVSAVDTPHWKSTLTEIISDSYQPVVNGVDLDNGTAQQLHQAFGDTGISGTTLRKSIRFYLDALDDAGLQRSPHFHPPKTKRSSSPKTTKKKDTETSKQQSKEKAPSPDSASGKAKEKQPPEGMIPLTVQVPERDQPCQFTFYEDISDLEMDYIRRQLDAWYELRKAKRQRDNTTRA